MLRINDDQANAIGYRFFCGGLTGLAAFASQHGLGEHQLEEMRKGWLWAKEDANGKAIKPFAINFDTFVIRTLA